MPTFKHSGNLGDVIYALPTVMSLGGGVLLLASGLDDMGIDPRCSRPNPMTTDIVFGLIELLKRQPYLTDVRIYEGEPVEYNLDKWREAQLSANRLSWRYCLSTMCLNAFKQDFDLTRPWLGGIEPLSASDVVINHSGRYLSNWSRLNWELLRGMERKCVFVGLPNEHKAFMHRTNLNIARYPVGSTLEFARIIKGSKLFIGNQSFGFAMAEAMKHPRVQEVCCFGSNCLPQTGNGWIHLSQGILKRSLLGQTRAFPSGLVDNALTQTRNWLYHFAKEGSIQTGGRILSCFERINSPTSAAVRRALRRKGDS